MVFNLRDLFTYIVITTLRILMLMSNHPINNVYCVLEYIDEI